MIWDPCLFFLLGNEIFPSTNFFNLAHRSIFGVVVSKVLEALPLNCVVRNPLYMFKIPGDEAVGEDEKDFSKVSVEVFKPDGTPSDEPAKPEFFTTGRLGVLSGGLLNVKDQRRPMSKEDVQAMAVCEVGEKLEKKRTEQLLHMLCYVCFISFTFA